VVIFQLRAFSCPPCVRGTEGRGTGTGNERRSWARAAWRAGVRERERENGDEERTKNHGTRGPPLTGVESLSALVRSLALVLALPHATPSLAQLRLSFPVPVPRPSVPLTHGGHETRAMEITHVLPDFVVLLSVTSWIKPCSCKPAGLEVLVVNSSNMTCFECSMVGLLGLPGECMVLLDRL